MTSAAVFFKRKAKTLTKWGEGGIVKKERERGEENELCCRRGGKKEELKKEKWIEKKMIWRIRKKKWK